MLYCVFNLYYIKKKKKKKKSKCNSYYNALELVRFDSKKTTSIYRF